MAVVSLPVAQEARNDLDRAARPDAGRQGRAEGAAGDVRGDHRQGPNWIPVRGPRGARDPLLDPPGDARSRSAPATSHAGPAEEGAPAERGRVRPAPAPG